MYHAKICACTAGDEHSELLPVLRGIHKVGIQAAEIWEPHLSAHAQQNGNIDAVYSFVEEKGIAVPCISGYFEFLQPDGGAPYTQEICRYAKLLGTPLVRVLADWHSSDKLDKNDFEKWRSNFKEATKIAKQYGVTLAFEPHANQQFDTLERCLFLLEELSPLGVRIVLDIFHFFYTKQDTKRATQLLLPYTEHIHIKNGTGYHDDVKVGLLLGQGAMDFTPFFEYVLSRYTGYYSIEFFGADFYSSIQKEAEAIQRYFSEPV